MGRREGKQGDYYPVQLPALNQPLRSLTRQLNERSAFDNGFSRRRREEIQQLKRINMGNRSPGLSIGSCYFRK